MWYGNALSEQIHETQCTLLLHPSVDMAMTSQWPDKCDANTWQVTSNSLDIDFIHDDVHGRSCKKLCEESVWCCKYAKRINCQRCANEWLWTSKHACLFIWRVLEQGLTPISGGKLQVLSSSLTPTRVSGYSQVILLTKKATRRISNGPNSHIPQYTSPISNNAPFCNRNMHMNAHFRYKMVHCGTFV